MQLKKVLILVVAAVLLTASATLACDRLWLAEGAELWLANEEAARLVVADAQGILHPRWSPEGKLIAYTHSFRFDSKARSEVVVVTQDGRPVQELTIPADSEVNAVLAVGWRNERHVFIEGHINPSTTKYLEWDVRTGRLVDEKVGSWFTVSPDGRSVAQRAHVPHGAPKPYDSALLLINEKRVYPATSDEAYHRFVGGFAWSPDGGRLAMVDQVEGSSKQVVILNASGEVVLRAPLEKALTPRELSWSQPNAIELREDGNVWRFDTSTGRVEPIRDVPLKLKSAEPPGSLRRLVGEAVLQAEDVRCP
ncbi:MAG TPA: hypothetical protein VH394_17895 [Thermoanaerobaculia bacterium]|jgi:dipeptidyl aminopeptidase/acylaminoacyl peptidase|nr:hypothetical protein [Thermoanaerobaculia bacterium]